MYRNLEAVGTFLVVQWLGLHTSTVVSILGYQPKKKKENCYFFKKIYIFEPVSQELKIDYYLQMMSLILG